MVFVHKRSPIPISPWDVLRHGGINNLDAGIKGKYLLLWNVQIVQREGAWHYILEFDVRDSLQTSALAQFMGKASQYPDDMDWRHWLGGQWQVISEAVREEILNMPPEDAHTEAMITDMREVPAARQIPGRSLDDPPYERPPDDFVLALPGPI
jgi:hypothetical protein